jgi:protein-S-isoprenylcysteine O-methyltransferase Ste14
VVGFIVNILAVLFIFVGSWYPTGFPKLSVWNAWMLAFTAVSVTAGITIYLISQRTRRGKTDEQFLSEIAPAVGGGGGE